jgi:hypothetical protein
VLAAESGPDCVACVAHSLRLRVPVRGPNLARDLAQPVRVFGPAGGADVDGGRGEPGPADDGQREPAQDLVVDVVDRGHAGGLRRPRQKDGDRHPSGPAEAVKHPQRFP